MLSAVRLTEIYQKGYISGDEYEYLKTKLSAENPSYSLPAAGGGGSGGDGSPQETSGIGAVPNGGHKPHMGGPSFADAVQQVRKEVTSSGMSDVPKSVLDEDVKLINELLQKLGQSVVTLQTIRDDILLGVEKYRKEYIAALEDLLAERQFQQKSPAATAQKALDVLNSAFEADPRALWAIWNHRVPANEGLQDHPRVVVDAVPGLGSSEYFLSLEGLLYGMFTAMGLPTITIDWEINTTRVNRFKGFRIRKEPVRVKNDGATADS